MGLHSAYFFVSFLWNHQKPPRTDPRTRAFPAVRRHARSRLALCSPSRVSRRRRPRPGSESRPTRPPLPLGSRSATGWVGRARALDHVRPLSTPLCIEAEERGECVLLTGYLTPMRASSISIPMHPRHCRHHLKSCTSRHIATQKSGERIRTTEETKRTAPVMQSGQKARPRLPGRLFNFHIPSPVRSVAATPAGIARPPKAKDNMQPL